MIRSRGIRPLGIASASYVRQRGLSSRLVSILNMSMSLPGHRRCGSGRRRSTLMRTDAATATTARPLGSAIASLSPACIPRTIPIGSTHRPMGFQSFTSSSACTGRPRQARCPSCSTTRFGESGLHFGTAHPSLTRLSTLSPPTPLASASSGRDTCK